MRPTLQSALRNWFFKVTFLVSFTGVAPWLPAQDVYEPNGFAALPNAPLPQVAAATPDTHLVTPDTGCSTPPSPASGSSGAPPGTSARQTAGVQCAHKFDLFYPLGKPPATGPLTRKDKLRIAASNVVDPFNLITIGASAAITIGSNPDTAYGPGMKGWAKNSGTLLTEDMTSAFFVTFLVPALTGQDPRYYRMPKASIPRRIANALVHPIWTRSDQGDHMLNYAELIGVPAAITLANVYVPGRKQGAGPTAVSSAIAIASSPIDNIVTEFLPDVAKHFSIRIVLIQRIVNHITLTGGES